MCDRLQTAAFVPVIHRVLDDVFHVITFVMNLILLWVVNNHSPKHMGVYKNIIRLVCANDLLLSFVGFLCQVVILPYKGNWVVFSNSCFSKYSPTVDFWFCVISVSTFYVNMLCTPIQYVVRYLSVTNRTPLSQRALLAIIIATLLHVVLGVLAIFFMMRPTPEFQLIALGVVRDAGWQPDIATDCAPFHFGGVIMTPEGAPGEVRVFFYFVLNGIICLVGYSIVIWTEVHVARTLANLGDLMTDAARQTHAEFKKALMLMAACPLLCFMLPIGFYTIVCFFRLETGAWAAFVTTWCTSVTFVNPIITIVVVQPYRSAVHQTFRAITKCTRIRRNDDAP